LLFRVEALEKALGTAPLQEARVPRGQANDNTTDMVRTSLPLTVHDSSTQSSLLYDDFPLPESTYTLLITHKFLSIPFFTGMITCGLPMFCLVLVLVDEADQGNVDNPLGLPAGVTTTIRIAQFLGKNCSDCNRQLGSIWMI
jgi:hypothetical protein